MFSMGTTDDFMRVYSDISDVEEVFGKNIDELTPNTYRLREDNRV